MKLVADILYEYLQNVQSLIAPSIAAVFVMGVFSKRVTPAGGLWGLVVGFIFGMLRLVLLIFQKYLNPEGILYYIVDINWLHYCIYLFFLSIAVIVVVSLFTPTADDERIKGLIYGSASPEQAAETRSSWNNWDVTHSLIIVGIVIAFYIYFW